jgi:hypothetical protein
MVARQADYDPFIGSGHDPPRPESDKLGLTAVE